MRSLALCRVSRDVMQEYKGDCTMCKWIHAFLIITQYVCSLICFGQASTDEELMKLTNWERGVKVESRVDKTGFAYLWFYEWHLFDAVKKGEHTWNDSIHQIIVDDAKGTSAQAKSKWLEMKVKATNDGANMFLRISNRTDYDWPEIAAIIPCFNPGNPENPSEQNPAFFDQTHEHTYFVGKDGLELIKGVVAPREIHFNHMFREKIMSRKKERDDGTFVFTSKWPTSGRDAYAGLLLRESNDKRWLMGIAWESFISVQGHNPWKCMHLSVRVGPLKKGETKTIRGKIYLFEGSKEDCFEKYRRDFPNEMNGRTAQQKEASDK
jgi:hypothetical protein